MDRRAVLKKKQNLEEKDEEEILKLEELIAEECQEENRKKVIENLSGLDGNNGNLSHQGIWKAKKEMFF